MKRTFDTEMTQFTNMNSHISYFVRSLKGDNIMCKRILLMIIASLSFTILLCSVSMASEETYKLKCYSASYDQDGDGYAAPGAPEKIVERRRKERLTCPVSCVPGKNDGDDNDESVHPRRRELQNKGKDDNCNGLSDEPFCIYPEDTSGITTDSFQIYIKVNDGNIVDNKGNLYADIEYAKLSDPWQRYRTRKMTVTLNEDNNRHYTTLTLENLSPTTVYMARVRFYKKIAEPPAGGTPVLALRPDFPDKIDHSIDARTGREKWKVKIYSIDREEPPIFLYPDREPEPRTIRDRRTSHRREIPEPQEEETQVEIAVPKTLSPIEEKELITKIIQDSERYLALGSVSDWYYSTTDGTKQKSKVRTKIVQKALRQFYDSEVGAVGLLGNVEINGKRYCGNEYDYWCSEFYAWCTEKWLDGIASCDSVDDLVGYFFFGEPGSVLPSYYMESHVEDVRRGDYVNFGGYHSGMFLSLEKNGSTNPDDWYIWTVEGNTDDRDRFDESGAYVEHASGNTVQVLRRRLNHPTNDVEYGFGHILYSHLRD